MRGGAFPAAQEALHRVGGAVGGAGGRFRQSPGKGYLL